MRVFVPFDSDDPKTRLGPRLDSDERATVARAMCRDVLDTLAETPHDPVVLATDNIDCDWPVRIDDQPLSSAVNDALTSTDSPAAVVMADLALATPPALERLFEPDTDVVLAPGLGGGTNALVARHPDFRVDYHGLSYRDHLAVAERVGAAVSTVDSFRLAVDIDDPGDLVEVLVHTDGHTAETLRQTGFEVTVEDGRATVTRSERDDPG